MRKTQLRNANAFEAGLRRFRVAAILGAGSCIALVLGVFSVNALSSPGLLVVVDISLAGGHNHLRGHLCLSSHGETPKATGVFDYAVATCFRLCMFFVASI